LPTSGLSNRIFAIRARKATLTCTAEHLHILVDWPRSDSAPPHYEMNVLGRLALLVSGVIVALLLAEGVVRVARVAPEVGYVARWRWRLSPNPKIGYEPIPNATPDDTERKPGYRGRANDLGFRDYDHPLRKPAGARRAIILGDSVTWGYRVANDDAVFPAVVERELTEAGVAADVLNFGVAGYNTQQEVETLEDKGLGYDPDLVVLAYCLNDEKTADGGLYAQLRAAERGASYLDAARLSPILISSALARFVYFRVLGRSTTPPGPDRSIFENRVRWYFGELRRMADAEGFEVLVVVFPNFGGLGRHRPYRFQAAHDRVRGYALENGFDYLDLLPTFEACQRVHPGKKIAFDSYHPTALGHHCAADAIAGYILEHLWAPGAP
jgi:lysophospholipase L1-like esterase